MFYRDWTFGGRIRPTKAMARVVAVAMALAILFLCYALVTIIARLI